MIPADISLADIVWVMLIIGIIVAMLPSEFFDEEDHR